MDQSTVYIANNCRYLAPLLKKGHGEDSILIMTPSSFLKYKQVLKISKFVCLVDGDDPDGVDEIVEFIYTILEKYKGVPVTVPIKIPSLPDEDQGVRDYLYRWNYMTTLIIDEFNNSVKVFLLP
jgi:hypothetical protein